MRGKVAKAIRRRAYQEWMELNQLAKQMIPFMRLYRDRKRMYKEVRCG